MKRALALAFVILCASQAFAQVGALMPSIYPVFNNTNGITPVALGYVCTTASGGSSPLATFREDTNMTANQNPIRLNAQGRAVNGSTLVPIFLAASQYRITLYAAGSANTCNGISVGAQIWQMDNVYDFAQLLAAGVITFTTINNRQFCSTGATFGAKFTAAAALLPSTGGIVDCSNLQGNQSILTDVFTSVTKPITLLWPSGTVSSAASLAIPANVSIDFGVAGSLSMAGGTNATFSSTVMGSTTAHFAGAGSFLLNGPQNDVPVQWFGALGDGSTDDATAIQRGINALSGIGGTLFFSASGRYPIGTQVIVSSTRPIHIKCDMFGQTWDTTTQGNGAIVVAAALSGGTTSMIQYTAPDAMNRSEAGGGSIEGCAFLDPTNRTRSIKAALDLHDFPLSQVRNNVIQYVKGSAILGEFLVMSEISGNIIRYDGDTSKPAVYLPSTTGAFIAQSLKIDGNRLEVNYSAEYLKLGASATAISVIDNRFETDTAVAASNQQFISSPAFYVRYIGNSFNRNTGTQLTISGAGNVLTGNVFQGGAYSPTALVISGGRNAVTGNIFESNRTGFEVTMVQDTTFVGNEMYFSGAVKTTGSGNTISGNSMYELTATSAVLGASDAFWIDSTGQSTAITGNMLDNGGGTVLDVGGIRLAGGLETASGNTVRTFGSMGSSGNGLIGISVEVPNAAVGVNTLFVAPIVETNYAGSVSDNLSVDGSGNPVSVPLYGTATYDPPSVPAVGMAANSVTTSVTVTGAAIGDPICTVQFSIEATGMLWRCYSSGANTVTVILTNTTSGAVDMGSGTLAVKVRKLWN